MGLKAEVNALSKRCQLAEDREAAANDRARLGEERAAVLTMELAKSRAEVSHIQDAAVSVVLFCKQCTAKVGYYILMPKYNSMPYVGMSHLA